MFYHPPPAIVVRFVWVAITALIGLICMNFFGQQIIDKKTEVFESAYFHTKWYLLSPKHRRYIHIILVASTDSSGISAGKMGDVSLEACGEVIFSITFS